MTEKIEVTNRDYQTVAMENAYKLAREYCTKYSNPKTKLLKIANLTHAIFEAMVYGQIDDLENALNDNIN